jgi:tetratricopeptide (TPR) repeat protein/predicted Ser/Thr protein kinase
MQPPTTSERDAECDECLDAETLAAYVDGLLAHAAIERADRHIDHCRACRAELSALAATTSFPMGSASPPIPDLESVPVVEGTLGRYRVERELGRGNMGVVVRAYDPELARAVAIKILAPKWAHGRDARERLRREAQAMARLSHPNVVQVYDVTSQGELLAIAMELVEGTTLREELGSRKTWQALLAICIAAGRGLAAAHAAKLIHRDYKPENVLCSEGRVVVSDFGLARLDESPPMPLDASATTTTLAGTPAYIAPELLLGEPATTASDQYSFCVATYEALYGERPFAGTRLEELRTNMANGRVRAAPVGSTVPIAVRNALLRGLSTDPAKRWPSMELLLAALDTPRARWPRILLAAGALGGIAVAAFTLRGAPSCDVEPFAWDRDGVTHALAQSTDGPRVIARFEAYERAWVAARRDACEATHVRSELSERALDARNACLDRGRREVVELASLVAKDPALAAGAVEAIGKLHDPNACTPETVAAVDPDVDRANALLVAGRTQDAIAACDRVLARTTPATVRAEAMLLRGRAEGLLERFDAAEQTLSDAITIAEQAQAGQVVAAIWVELVQITGAQNHRFEAARANMRAAEAAFARVDPGPQLRARHAYVVGAMLLARGQLDEARGHLERALVILGPERTAERGVTHGALCDLHRQKRDIPKARAQCQLAVDLMTSAYGPDHQKLGVIYNVWGTVDLFDRKLDDARAKWQRSIAIFERRNMQHDRGYALAFSNIGVSWAEQRDFEQARPHYERARDLFAQHHPKHVQRTLPLQGLASVALNTKDYRGAIAAYEATLDVIEDAYGKEDSRRTTVLFNLALAYQRLPDLAKTHALAEEVIVQSSHPGREQSSMIAYALDLQAALVEKQKDWSRAIALRERALAALDHKDEPPLRAWIEMEIGRVMRNAGQIATSIPHLEHAVAFYTKDRNDLQRAGTTQFWLAKSLWETNGDRRRAVALARAARSDLEAAKMGMNIEVHRTQVADWLAKHK